MTTATDKNTPVKAPISKAPITTHILNLETGKPAAGVLVKLFVDTNTNTGSYTETGAIASATTDADGRILHWDNAISLAAGIYRLEFFVGAWYAANAGVCFYPQVDIRFSVSSLTEHYHVPLLLSAYGYSTYRGS